MSAPLGMAPVNTPGGQGGQFATAIGRDRLIRQEVSLGVIREIVPPENHIGLSLFPFMESPTDDVTFNYITGQVDGLAPARAEDAESELAQKDDVFLGEGRASIMDWAIKDHYSASDVSRYREWLTILEQVRDTQSLPLTVTSMTKDFPARMARDAEKRVTKLYNRFEWLLINQALDTGKIVYNDGKIKFAVDFGRPTGQQAITLANIPGNSGAAQWDGDPTLADPIKDLLNLQQYSFDHYGVHIATLICSQKIINSIMLSNKFAQRTGIVVPNGSGGITSGDPNYLLSGWGPEAAKQIVEQATGIKFMVYDSVYRTRPINSTSVTANRFMPQNHMIALPDMSDLSLFDDTSLGFGKMVTSPHPAGNWSAGFYEWERDYGVDPWGLDAGTGIKAFPVLPHLDLSWCIQPIT